MANDDMYKILDQALDSASNDVNNDEPTNRLYTPSFDSQTFAQEYNNQNQSSLQQLQNATITDGTTLIFYFGHNNAGTIQPDYDAMIPNFSINGVSYLFGDGGTSHPVRMALNNSTNFTTPSAIRLWNISNDGNDNTITMKYSMDFNMNSQTYTFDAISTMQPVSAGRVKQTTSLRNVTGLDSGHPVTAPGLTIGTDLDTDLNNVDAVPLSYTGYNQGIYMKAGQYQLNIDTDTTNGPTGWAASNFGRNFSDVGLTNGSSLGQKASSIDNAPSTGTTAFNQGDSAFYMIWNGQDLPAGDSRNISWIGRIQTASSPTYIPRVETRTVTKTYKFNDATNGNTVAPDVVQNFQFERKAYYNASTNALIGYTDANDELLPASDADQAWHAVGSNQTGGFTIPDLSKQGFDNANQGQTEPLTNLTYNDTSTTTVIPYTHKMATVTPETNATTGQTMPGVNAVYPAGVTHDDLYHQAIRTITYTDDDNHNQTVAPTVTQSVTLKRNAVIDETNGKIVGYTKPNDTTIQSDPDTAWTPIDANNAQWSAVNSPDLANLGYTTPDTTTVPTTAINSTASNASVNVHYHHQLAVLTHIQTQTTGDRINADGNATWPSGISTSDLDHQVHRQINVFDQRGHNLVTPLNQFAEFTRNAVVDKVTGQLLGYINNDDTKNITPVSDGDKAWTPQDKQFDAVSLPDLSKQGYINPDTLNVPTVDVKATDNADYPALTFVYKDGLTTVNAQTAQTPGQKINEQGDTVWPEGTDANSLQSKYQRTIQYVDNNNHQITLAPSVTQAVSFNRTAVVDKVTGKLLGYSTDGSTNVKPNYDGWNVDQQTLQTVTTPQMTKYGYLEAQPQVDAKTIQALENGNDTIVIPYLHHIINVDANSQQQQGNVIDKDNPNQIKFQSDVSPDNLTDNNTRTINFLDAESEQPIQPAIQQTVTYHRVAMVDAVTGQLLGYQVNHEMVIPNDNGAWIADEQPQFNAVAVPSFNTMGYIAPYEQVDSMPSRAENPQVINIMYQHQHAFINNDNDFTTLPTPMNPIPLTTTSTRQINYVDAITGQPIVNPIKETVTYQRTPVVDKVDNHIIGWSLNHKGLIDIAADDPNYWYTTDDQWDTATSPDLTAQGYTKPDTPLVTAQSVQPGDNNTQVNINYGHQTEIVNINDKAYPDELTKDDLEKTITRKIQYVDRKTKQSIAPDTVETVTYYRNPIVDKVTHQIVGYANPHTTQPNLLPSQSDEAWYTTNNQWDAVKTPTVNGYQTPMQTMVNAWTVDKSQPDTTVMVEYDKQITPTEIINSIPTSVATKPTSAANNPSSSSSNSNSSNIPDEPMGPLKKLPYEYAPHAKQTKLPSSLAKSMANSSTPQPNHSHKDNYSTASSAMGLTSQSIQPSTANSAQEEPQLPQTGEDNHNGLLAVIGTLMLSLSGLLAITPKKRHD